MKNKKGGTLIEWGLCEKPRCLLPDSASQFRTEREQTEISQMKRK